MHFYDKKVEKMQKSEGTTTGQIFILGNFIHNRIKINR